MQRKSVDLYELRPVHTDNDSYYVPPRSSYNHCATINDAPSCNGS